MLSRAAKDQQIKEFNAAFKEASSVMVVEYKGLTVVEMEKLRKDVRDAQAELTVVKNTLLRIAAKDTDIEQIGELFEGPTAVAICESDPSAVAKVFVNTIKDAPQLKLKGGFVDGSVLDGEAISELSKLPSRPEMLAKIMGLLKAPMSNVVGVLTGMQTKLLYALEAVKEKKENEPQAAPEPEKAEEAPVEAKEEPKQEKETPEGEAKAEEPKEEAKSEETAEEAKSEEASETVEDTKEEAASTEEAPETKEAQAQEAAAEEAPSEAESEEEPKQEKETPETEDKKEEEK